ncbi:MAG: 2-amino-4-hydroxy-6-hydroxymethyldihydropteridine diphosphokinase [Alistipes sp.]|nr:2-amino-4-hydroxy-6-hydroxymethyldihydropteridine diphosphokinase [Alistipes sp.]
MTRAAILTGANAGDAAATLQKARLTIERLAGRIAAASEVMRSRAWGFESDQEFLNQALIVETQLGPQELLEALMQTERECGRDRGAELKEKQRTGSRYASRIIDADMIFYGSQIIDTPLLTVPHPRLAQREFALRPLAQIIPQFRHPVTGRSVEQMLNDIAE